MDSGCDASGSTYDGVANEPTSECSGPAVARLPCARIARGAIKKAEFKISRLKFSIPLPALPADLCANINVATAALVVNANSRLPSENLH